MLLSSVLNFLSVVVILFSDFVGANLESHHAHHIYSFNGSFANLKLTGSAGSYRLQLHYKTQHNDCEAYSLRKISDDVSFSKLVKDSVGPHEVYVSIEGLGLYAHLFKYVKCNQYEVNFHVH